MRRRFESHLAHDPEQVRELAADHPAVAESRTLFPGTVVAATASPRILVSGVNQRKIGSHVTKGRWAGMPIFSLTLEERATCPSSCHNWRTCYGNNMHWSRRHRHGAEMEFLLDRELKAKQTANPAGFVVRLHILGDFYDAGYAALWGRWLQQYPALRCFGFTARHEMSDEGILIRMLNRDYADRFVIRFSTIHAGAVPGVRYAVTVSEMPQATTVAGAVVCPAETGRTAACGSCGFCWTGTKDVAFIMHGRLGLGYRDSTEAANAAYDPEPQVTQLPMPGAARPSTGRGPGKTVGVVQAAPPPQPHPSTATATMVAPHLSGFASNEAVPLRGIEIRAWLEGVGADSDSFSDDAGALSAANRIRAAMQLPPVRLIPACDSARYQEVIVPIQRARKAEVPRHV